MMFLKILSNIVPVHTFKTLLGRQPGPFQDSSTLRLGSSDRKVSDYLLKVSCKILETSWERYKASPYLKLKNNRSVKVSRGSFGDIEKLPKKKTKECQKI